MILCFVCVNDCFEVVWSDNVAVTECLVICEGNVRWPSSAQHNAIKKANISSQHKFVCFFKISLCCKLMFAF